MKVMRLVLTSGCIWVRGATAQVNSNKCDKQHSGHASDHNAHNGAYAQRRLVTAGAAASGGGVLRGHAGTRGGGQRGHILVAGVLVQQVRELVRLHAAGELRRHEVVRHAAAGRHLDGVLQPHRIRSHCSLGARAQVGLAARVGQATGRGGHLQVLDILCGGADGGGDGGDEHVIVVDLIAQVGVVRDAVHSLYYIYINTRENIETDKHK